MALRAGVYLVLGGIGGVALAENKELVPTVCSCVPVCACNCAVHPGRPGGEATQRRELCRCRPQAHGSPGCGAGRSAITCMTRACSSSRSPNSLKLSSTRVRPASKHLCRAVCVCLRARVGMDTCMDACMHAHIFYVPGCACALEFSWRACPHVRDSDNSPIARLRTRAQCMHMHACVHRMHA